MAKEYDDFCADEPERGPWMQTSRGERFFPMDPRPEDIHIEDIANGLAQCGRYNGQRLIDRYYSVAEHCVQMAKYAKRQGHTAEFCLGVLMHDAAEAYVNDLNRATKQSLRIIAYDWEDIPDSHYDRLSRRIEKAIWGKYSLLATMESHGATIKEIDCRIVGNEKPAVMAPCAHSWAYDQFQPLEGVQIECWPAPLAKEEFLWWFQHLTSERNG